MVTLDMVGGLSDAAARFVTHYESRGHPFLSARTRERVIWTRIIAMISRLQS